MKKVGIDSVVIGGVIEHVHEHEMESPGHATGPLIFTRKSVRKLAANWMLKKFRAVSC